MSEIRIKDMTVNYLESPCGIDSLPRFSYKVESDINEDSQKGALISLSEKADFSTIIWKKLTIGSQKNFIECKKKLKPVTKYYWKVEVDCISGAKIFGTSSFVTGKLDERWNGKWIDARVGPERRDDPNFLQKIEKSKNDKDFLQAPYIRKDFTLSQAPKEAYLSIIGLGYFVAEINGQKVGDDVLSPGFTRFDKTDYYMQYDVSSLLQSGDNTIGIVLGNGWFNCFAEDPWNTRQASWRTAPKLLAEIKVVYEDKKIETIGTDDTWKVNLLGGPIYFNGIRNGEHYDANKELGDWTSPGYDDTDWDPVRISRSPGGELRASEFEPIKPFKSFTAVKKWKKDDKWILDFGQNGSGYGIFKFKGKAGTEFTIRYSDILTADGNLDTASIGGFVRSHGFQTDKYTKKSDDVEVWHPVFVYHGFQYMEITGMDYEPEPEDVTAQFICSAVKVAGHFECSDELLNKLQRLCFWSSVSNMESIPTDCPHREKNGWTGDASISSEQMMMNFGSAAFFSKWSRDIRDSQRPAGQIPCVIPSTGWGYNSMNGPDWSSALVNVPFNIFLYEGDEQILKVNYDAIKKNCDFMESMTTDYTLNYGLGDWCAPFEGPAISKNMGSFKCPTEVTDTAFFYNAAKLTSSIASKLGKKDDVKYYSILAQKIKKAFRDSYFDKKTFTVKGDCQTSTAVMLYFGLNEPNEKQGLLDKLVEQIELKDWHLDFGILGCKFVMHSLGDAGLGYIGQRMIAQRTYPGCQEWINRGATTLWECWNGLGSHNHHMFSDLSAFMYKYVAGIAPVESDPGFHTTEFRPALKCGMQSASASHESMYGTVACSWKLTEESAETTITIPFGCKGNLYLPKNCSEFKVVDGTGNEVSIKGKLVGNEYLMSFKSGKYTVSCMTK
ncbi:MAG: glycoside hydrolase family 78 protein [Clostridiales bacterium]|nr:glycoside hydrolase family 78 protein [Clostridiales bacterium]